MADLGKAYVQIIPKATGISDKIKESISPGAKQAGNEAGSNIVSNIKKTIAGAAIGATVVKGFKAALDEGGKLQQSFGGLDTLYGDAAEAAKNYAQEAAKAGISANDYAEQAVSFGASLKAAFGGDTAAAAEAANTAIMDMADNAAKMGTPLESLQNAYQGFAKGNYTMLDNLKLGYGGTKSEMERLLADATKLTGVKYDVKNLGDVYAAIHAVQENLGLTGVAADEAATTFSGSFGAMQAAASNLMASLALGEDVRKSMSTFIDSVGTFVTGNLLPMIGNVLSFMPQALDSAFSSIVQLAVNEGPAIVENLVSGFSETAPVLIEHGAKLLSTIIEGIQTNLPKAAEMALEVMSNIGTAITENLPTVLDKGSEIITSLVDGILAAIPNMAERAGEVIQGFGQFLSDNIPTLAQKGGELMESLGGSLVENLPKIATSLGKLGLMIIQTLAKLVPQVLKAGANIIGSLAKGMGGSALSLVKTAMNNIKSAMEQPIQNAKDTLSGIIDGIKGFFPISLGSIFDNIALPHFKVDGGQWPYGIGGKGYMPSFGVDWYAKAMEQPYMFNRASLIGVGEAGDEMVYGRQALLRDIREASGGGQTVNVNVTVNGADNPEEWADRLVREFVLKARTA